MSARARLAAARSLARLVVDAWPVLVRGYLHPCAEQVPLSQPRRAGHPGWCAQGQGGCAEPRRYPDDTVEWDHNKRVDVRGEHGAGDVFLVRIDAVRDGEQDVCEALVLTADGTFSADQAEAYALSILRAVRQIDAGLDGTPGGIPAALAALPEPWPPADHHANHDQQGDEPHGRRGCLQRS